MFVLLKFRFFHFLSIFFLNFLVFGKMDRFLGPGRRRGRRLQWSVTSSGGSLLRLGPRASAFSTDPTILLPLTAWGSPEGKRKKGTRWEATLPILINISAGGTVYTLSLLQLPGQDCKATDNLVCSKQFSDHIFKWQIYIFWQNKWQIIYSNIYDCPALAKASLCQLRFPPRSSNRFASNLEISISIRSSKQDEIGHSPTLPFVVVPPHPTPAFFGFLKIVEGFLSFLPNERLWMIYYLKCITWSKRFFQKLWDLYMRHSNRQIHRRQI